MAWEAVDLINIKILEGFKTSTLLQDIKRQNLSFILHVDAHCASILIVPRPLPEGVAAYNNFWFLPKGLNSKPTLALKTHSCKQWCKAKSFELSGYFFFFNSNFKWQQQRIALSCANPILHGSTSGGSAVIHQEKKKKIARIQQGFAVIPVWEIVKFPPKPPEVATIMIHLRC